MHGCSDCTICARATETAVMCNELDRSLGRFLIVTLRKKPEFAKDERSGTIVVVN